MSTVRISPKYQIVIPRDVREHLGLRPGQQVDVFLIGNTIQVVPVRPMKELRGIARGIDTTVPREEDREL